MVKCLICHREFKNDAGLAGHMRLLHPSASTVDGHELEARLQAVETSVAGMGSAVIEAVADKLVELTDKEAETRVLMTAMYLHHSERAHGTIIDTDELPEAVRIMFKKLRKDSTPKST